MAEHELVIRGGTVVDGTGAPARTADVAITDGLVTAVGEVDGRGRREIDADGALVTPGFVDIHTPYDVPHALPPIPAQLDAIGGRVTVLSDASHPSSVVVPVVVKRR